MTPLMCMAVAVFFEANLEPLQGKQAVTDVIQNRVEDRRYPNDICSVVYEPYAFSFTHDGVPDHLPDGNAAEYSLKIAQWSLRGNRLGITSTHYHNGTVSPGWSKVFDFDGRIGGHYFYTNNTRYK